MVFLNTLEVPGSSNNRGGNTHARTHTHTHTHNTLLYLPAAICKSKPDGCSHLMSTALILPSLRLR